MHLGFLTVVFCGVCLLSNAQSTIAGDVDFRENLALLRAARQAVVDGELNEADAIYNNVLRKAGIPPHHRWEAKESLKEIARVKNGLPARDPKASRIKLSERPKSTLTLYISPDGNDADDGSKQQPFRTLKRARNAIRAVKKSGGLPAGGVEVRIRGGVYRVNDTFELTEEDSGTEKSPIIYRAEQNETPRFSGGVRITGFQPVEDESVLNRLPEESRGKVFCANLNTLGIKKLKPLTLAGSGLCRPLFRTYPTPEVFFNGRTMTLARWPNVGFAHTGDVVQLEPERKRGFVYSNTGWFKYEGDRPKRWLGEPDVWLQGYWFKGWTESCQRIESINTEKREIKLAAPYHKYGYRKGQPFRAINLLAEIDSPGEWYIDREKSLLYFWPPSDPNEAEVVLSLCEVPLMNISDVSHITFECLVWECAAGDVIKIKSGDHCLFAGCTVRCCGGTAIDILGGTNHGILSCDIHSMGRGGVYIEAGDRKTLTPAGHFVENCHIHDLSRIDRTYTPAVRLRGVGSRVSHNRIHDIASSAVRSDGNDHLVELNNIFRVVQESDDQGAVESFINPTFRGNIVRFNLFRELGTPRTPGISNHYGWAGVRLDDRVSGYLIYGNIFYRASSDKFQFGAIQINQGKDTFVDNNVFFNSATVVSFTCSTQDRWKKSVAGVMDAPEIDRDLYLRRYPALKTLSENAYHNTLTRNLALRCGRLVRFGERYAELIDNLMTPEYADLYNAETDELRIEKISSAIGRIGMRPIPVDEIGLYVDSYRRECAEDTRAAQAAYSTSLMIRGPI